MTTYDLTVCVYEGDAAAAIVTGLAGNQYGLCASCKNFHDRQQEAAPSIAAVEDFRCQLRAVGLSTPAAEEFADHMVALLSVVQPKDVWTFVLTAIDHTTRRRAEAAGVAS